MVALGALSFMLRLDGQNSVADHYDQINKEFIQYWFKNASVSANVTNIMLRVHTLFMKVLYYH